MLGIQIISFIGLLIALVFFVRWMIKIRKEPEHQANKVRAIFQRLKEVLAENRIDFTIERGESTYVHIYERWEIRGYTTPLSCGLELFFISSLDGPIMVDFRFQKDPSVSETKSKAAQDVHQINLPLVLGLVTKKVVIPQYGWMMDLSKLATEVDVDQFAKCVVSRVKKYLELVKAVEVDRRSLAATLAQADHIRELIKLRAIDHLIDL